MKEKKCTYVYCRIKIFKSCEIILDAVNGYVRFSKTREGKTFVCVVSISLNSCRNRPKYPNQRPVRIILFSRYCRFPNGVRAICIKKILLKIEKCKPGNFNFDQTYLIFLFGIAGFVKVVPDDMINIRLLRTKAL